MTPRFPDRIALGALCLPAIGAMTAHSEPLEITFSQASDQGPVAEVLALAPTSERQPTVNRDMVQRNRRFHPHVLVVPKGSTVNFPNEDNTQHHVYSFSRPKTFELELFADTPKKPVRFDNAGIVEIGCNIHDHMQAFIVVTHHQAVHRSSGDGRITIPEPQASKLRANGSLKVWHPRMRDASSLRSINFRQSGSESLSVQLDLRPEPDEGEFQDLQRRFQDL